MDVELIALIIVLGFFVAWIINAIYTFYGDQWLFQWWMKRKGFTRDCGVKINFSKVVDFRNRKGEKNYYGEYPSIKKDIYGMQGKITDVYNSYLVVELFDKDCIDDVYVKWERIKDNPRCLLWGNEKIEEVKKLKIKSNMNKKCRMPRIFRWAIYLGIVNLFWQFVTNAREITTFVVGQIIK